MQAEFWLEKWAQPEQGWVQGKVNSRLLRYWPALGLEPGAPVLVPLCGDSIDLDWLVANGHKVCGAELSQSAIEGWAARHGLQLVDTADAASPGESAATLWTVSGKTAADVLVALDGRGSVTEEVTEQSPGVSRKQVAPHFICGDFLKLQSAELPFEPAAVYDRAALIALPPAMRKLYAAKLAELLQPGSKILLITLAYDQQKMKGPPFAVQDDEVVELFSSGFEIEQRGSSGGPEIVGNLSGRGLDSASESVFLMTRTV